ncbi:hypothetical protein ACFSYD_12475 [Paracoccus aerius]
MNTLIADITDSGQVFNALTTHFGFDGFDDGAPPKAPTPSCISRPCRA